MFRGELTSSFLTYLGVLIGSMLEGTTEIIIGFKESCLDRFGAGQELISCFEIL